MIKMKITGTFNPVLHSRRGDSNPRPADYESAAIPLSHDGKLNLHLIRI